MGSCAGKPKPVDGVKPEVVDQATDDSKATTLNSDNEKTIAEKNKIDVTTTNNKDEEKESTRQGEETIKEPSSGNNELKTEAPAEKEKVAEEKVEEERVEEKKVEISTSDLFQSK